MMFATDADDASRQLAILDRGIRKRALYDALLAALAVPIGLAGCAFVVHEAIASQSLPIDLWSFAAVGLAIVSFRFVFVTLRKRTFEAYARPAESRLHQTLVSNAGMVSEFGAVIGARHAIRMRLRDGSFFDLPIERDEVDGLLAFLAQRCPAARPVARPA